MYFLQGMHIGSVIDFRRHLLATFMTKYSTQRLPQQRLKTDGARRGACYMQLLLRGFVHQKPSKNGAPDPQNDLKMSPGIPQMGSSWVCAEFCGFGSRPGPRPDPPKVVAARFSTDLGNPGGPPKSTKTGSRARFWGSRGVRGRDFQQI